MRVAFNAKNSFTSYWSVIGFWNELPCSILDKGVELLVHFFTPLWVLECLCMGSGFKGCWKGM